MKKLILMCASAAAIGGGVFTSCKHEASPALCLSLDDLEEKVNSLVGL